jgi:hypothetical protein
VVRKVEEVELPAELQLADERLLRHPDPTRHRQVQRATQTVLDHALGALERLHPFARLERSLVVVRENRFELV